MNGGGETFEARLIRTDGTYEDIELHSDTFFLDNLLEAELETQDVDFYWVRGHAIVYDVWAMDRDKARNGTASSMVGHSVYGDVILVPRRFLRNHGNMK